MSNLLELMLLERALLSSGSRLMVVQTPTVTPTYKDVSYHSSAEQYRQTATDLTNGAVRLNARGAAPLVQTAYGAIWTVIEEITPSAWGLNDRDNVPGYGMTIPQLMDSAAAEPTDAGCIAKLAAVAKAMFTPYFFRRPVGFRYYPGSPVDPQFARWYSTVRSQYIALTGLYDFPSGDLASFKNLDC